MKIPFVILSLYAANAYGIDILECTESDFSIKYDSSKSPPIKKIVGLNEPHLSTRCTS
eukprot:Pgem_evm1s3970